MDKNSIGFYKVKNTVGPIDRILRGFIGLMILITTHSLNLTILDFALLHIITVYFWVTGLTGWDPVYALIKGAWGNAKDTMGINGRFKI